MAARLLLIEDDPRLADLVRDYLAAGISTHAATVQGSAAAIEREAFDAIVLDPMLPGS